MSEYGRQIALGAVVAVVVALGLGFGAGYYFPASTVSRATTEAATSTETVAQTTSAMTSSASSATTTAVTQTMTSTVITTSVSSATETSTITSSSISSVTSPCSAPGVQCGSFQIVAVKLTATGTQPGFSNLSLTLRNTGNAQIGSFEIFLDYNVNASQLLGAPVPPGEQTTFSMPISNAHFPVTPGKTYTVLVEGFIIDYGHITANLWRSQGVVAQL